MKSTMIGKVNLRHLFGLRCLAILGQLITLIMAQYFYGVQLPWLAMLIVISLEIFFNALTWLRIRHAKPEKNRELFGQLFVDLSALTALLYLSGGLNNPFISLYLPALAIGAAVLPRKLILLLALLTTGAYFLLLSNSVPLKIAQSENLFEYYQLGTWISFLICVVLIVWFVTRMSKALRLRETALAQAHQRLMQDERVVALGAQAATIAHEMGTPLSTMAILIEALRNDIDKNVALKKYQNDFILLERQIDFCKSALLRLQSRASNVKKIVSQHWIDHFIEQWRLHHPHIVLKTKYYFYQDIVLEDPIAVGQILTILLDNASRASPHKVVLQIKQLRENIAFIIYDRGAGIPIHLRSDLGNRPIDSTRGGAGVGLYLAFSTVDKLSGTIELKSNVKGGVCAILTLPINTDLH